mgnify:CR=1 FL=1
MKKYIFGLILVGILSTYIYAFFSLPVSVDSISSDQVLKDTDMDIHCLFELRKVGDYGDDLLININEFKWGFIPVTGIRFQEVLDYEESYAIIYNRLFLGISLDQQSFQCP